MSFNTFNNENELILEVSERITACIKESIATYDDARILLSGGSTPGPVYAHLSSLDLDWKKVHIGLVDERFVPSDNEFSNERLLFETLIKDRAKGAQFTGMVYDPSDRIKNLSTAISSYAPFMERTDFVLLGMGGDGHTASLFPGDPASEADLENSTLGLINTNAPTHPTDRISCSKSLLLQAKHIALMIKGAQKREVLKNTSSHLPIHTLMAEQTAIETYYCE